MKKTKLFSGVEMLENRILMSALPATVNVYNVTAYGAIANDGVDDTAAIQAAMNAMGNNASRTLYLPNGTYDINNTLSLSNNGFSQVKRTTVEGESKSGVILRLASGSLTDAANPKPVIDFNRGATVAQAFFNFLRDVTIQVQPNNAGAIGVSFYSNNGGAIRDVDVLSQNGNGEIGVKLNFTENGPLSVSNLRVDGFKVGVKTSDHINSQTFTNLTLNGQSVYGFENGTASGGRQAVAIRNLVTSGTVPGYYARYEDPDPNTVIVGATMTGTGAASTQYAVNTGGPSYVRGLTTTGYLASYQMKWDTPVITASGNGTNLEASSYGSGSTNGYSSLFSTTASGLNLPVATAPSIPWGNVATQWTVPASNPTGDDTAVIQAAIDATGAHTVYLPAGTWTINGTLVLRGEVRRLIGLGGTLEGTGTIRVDDGAGNTPVAIERLFTSANQPLKILHNSARTLVMTDIGADLYSNTASGTGDVFVDGFVGQQMAITNQRAYLTQINLEAWTLDRYGIGAFIRNDGGLVSLLGFKTENRATTAGTFIHTLNGGQTELLGGLNYYNAGTWPTTTPAYKVADASFGMATLKAYDPGSTGNSPTIFVQDTKAGVTNNLNMGSLKRSYFISRSALAMPAVPTGSSSAAVNPTRIDVSWTDAATTEIGYTLQRSTASNFSASLVTFTLPAGTVGYSDTPVAQATTYYYRVRADGANGSSAWSATASAVTPSSESATVRENFNYTLGSTLTVTNTPNGGTLSALTGWTGGTGFDSGAWGLASAAGSRTTPGTQNVTASIVAGLTLGSLTTSGNAVQLQAADLSGSAQVILSRGLNAVPVGTTVWGSYLFRPTVGTAGRLSDVRPNTSQFATGNAKLRNVADADTSSLRGGVAADGTATLSSAAYLTNATTYLSIAKFSNVGVANTSAKWWAVTAAQFSAAAADGTVTEAELDAANTATATDPAVSARTLTTADFLQLYGRRGTMTFDEIRLGAALSDVTPNSGSGGGQRVAKTAVTIPASGSGSKMVANVESPASASRPGTLIDRMMSCGKAWSTLAVDSAEDVISTWLRRRG